MKLKELCQPANLMSLSRIPLGGVVVFYLAQDYPAAPLIALLVFIFAGITDGLDGYLARRSSSVTELGTALDPIADKVFAGIVTIGLILFRDFPLWLAAAIVGRDLLILGFGKFLARGREIKLPSNMLGKWTFAALATLLGAYVIRFEFSIALMTPIVVALLVASLISYGRVFVDIKNDRRPEPFVDGTLYRWVRFSLLAAVVIAHAVMFYKEFLG